MNKLKVKNSYVLYMVLVVVFLTACTKRIYYNYDIEQICKECEKKGGVNRFYTANDDIDIYVICNDGTKKRLK